MQVPNFFDQIKEKSLDSHCSQSQTFVDSERTTLLYEHIIACILPDLLEPNGVRINLGNC